MIASLVNNVHAEAIRLSAGASGGDGIPVPTWFAMLIVILAVGAVVFAISRWIKRMRK